MSTSSTAGELTHEEARELLDAWHDGELEAQEAARVEGHVRSCERCQLTERALGGGLRLAIQAASDAEPRVDLLPGIQRRLNLRSQGRFYRSARRRYSAWPMLFGSLMMMAVLVLAYLLQVWVMRE